MLNEGEMFGGGGGGYQGDVAGQFAGGGFMPRYLLDHGAVGLPHIRMSNTRPLLNAVNQIKDMERATSRRR